MRVALAVVLAIHGLIHILGFVKLWGLLDVSQLSGHTLVRLSEPLSRLVGLAWLLVCLALVTAAAMVFLRGPWWLVAVVAIAVSQLLVILDWHDAKAGTLVNLLLIVPALVAWADARFQGDTDHKVRALLAGANQGPVRTVTAEQIALLPAPVQRWLEASGAVGKPVPHTVQLEQRGYMRVAPGKPELRATATQVFRVEEPAFIWRVRVRMLGVVPLAGRDSYVDGRGRMLIKLASWVPVVDAADDKIDQGALLRFLGETVWFPGASVQPYIRWEPVDEASARATMTYRGVSASAVFSFDEHGRFTTLRADRYFGGGPDAKLEVWEIEAQQWDTMAGCSVPVKGEVRWKLSGGDFTFYRWEITELEYDPPAPKTPPGTEYGHEAP